MAGKRKGKFPRRRSQKVLNRRRMRTRKYKNSGWKLKYPQLFMEVNYYPYIIRRDDKKH